MQKTFYPGFTSVKHSRCTLLKSPWTKVNSSHWKTVHGFCFSGQKEKVELNNWEHFPRWEEMEKCLNMSLIAFEVWQWHAARIKMLCESEKMVLYQTNHSRFRLKKKLLSLQVSQLLLSKGQVSKNKYIFSLFLTQAPIAFSVSPCCFCSPTP